MTNYATLDNSLDRLCLNNLPVRRQPEIKREAGPADDTECDVGAVEVVERSCDNVEDSSNTEQVKPGSAFYGSDITLNCVEVDLSKKPTICMISDYTWNVRKMILKKFYDESCAFNEPPSPMMELNDLPPASIGAFFMCNGQPAAQLLSIIAADNQRYYLGRNEVPFPEDLFPERSCRDRNENSDFDKWFHQINCRVGFLGPGKLGSKSRFYGKFIAFPGAFHAGMKLHNCSGMMFGNFLEAFFGA